MKKILQIFLFCVVFSIFVFGQEFKDLPKNPQEIVSFQAKLGFENSEDKIVSFKFFDNEQKLLLLGVKNIQVWDVIEDKVLNTIPHEIQGLDKAKTGIRAEISHDGQKVVVFDLFSYRLFGKPKQVTASVFDLQTGKKIKELDGIEKGIRLALWRASGETLITFSEFYSSDNNELEFCSWDGETLNRRFCKTIIGNLQYPLLSKDGTKIFLSLNIEKNRSLLSSNDYVVGLYDALNGEFIKQFRQSIDSYALYLISPNAKYLVADNRENKTTIWKLTDNFPIKFTFGTEKLGSARFYGFNSDGNLFAVRNEERLEIYDSETEKKEFEINEVRNHTSVLFSPDNKFLIAEDCEKADVFDLTTQKKLYQIRLVCKSKSDYVSSYIGDFDRISFHPNGEFFLTYSDKTARIWDTKTGTLLQTVINPENKKTKRKNKNADDGLSDSAGWILGGKFLYVLAADKESILIWKVS